MKLARKTTRALATRRAPYRLYPAWRAGFFAWLGWLGVFLASTAQAQFVPNETLVSPNPGLIDFEFSQTRGKFAWTDPNGILWLGGVNADTGNFEPVSGQGVKIATNTVSKGNMFLWNGPEWISMASGDQIYYSYYLAGAAPVAMSTRMALAVQNPSGAWVTQPLGPNVPRMSDASSHNKGDPNPQILYFDPSMNHYWRNVLDATSEQLLPFLNQGDKAWRLATGVRAIPYTAPVNGISQVFGYMLDTGVNQQLTFDTGNKDPNRTVPWMWRAPEFNNDLVFFTFAEGSELRVYRQTTGSNGKTTWNQVYKAALPTGRLAGSPEWFTYNGKSYVFMAVYVPPNIKPNTEFPSEIWISNIDAAQPMLKRITDNSLLRVRNDPEVFVTSKGPLIYYNRYNPSLSNPPGNPLCGACSEGVYRADPGLSIK